MLNVPIFLGPVASPGYYGQGENNAWHLQTDWDNYLGLPLVLGCYAWWWIFAAASTFLLILSLI